MSYSIQIGAEGFEQIASNAGYAAFGDWVESLDLEKYGELIHLYEWGWSQNLDDLQSQIVAAENDDAPDEESVSETLAGIVEIIESRPEDAVVATITGGISEGEDDEESAKSFNAPRGDEPIPTVTPPLPNADALANALRHVYRLQQDQVMHAIDSVLDMKSWLGLVTKDESPVTDDANKDDEERAYITSKLDSVTPAFDLSTWDATVAKVAEPLMLKYAQQSVKEAIAALPQPKLKLDLFDVVDRNLPNAVNDLTLKFAQSTNETTSKELTDSIAELRDELEEGVTIGDVRTQMRNRVQSIFEDLSNERADLIARTEASRVRHDAQLTTVKESGVVKTKSWLPAADACPICLGFAAQGQIPLDANFGETKYGPIKAAPGHPSCYCSILFQLKDNVDSDESEVSEPETADV